MPRLIYYWFCLFSVSLFPFIGAEQESSQPNVFIELISEESSVQPGGQTWVALHFHLADGWHAYWKNPGDSGMPVSVDWKIPAGIQVGNLEWPSPEKFELDGLVGYGYDKDFVLLAPITADKEASSGSSADLTATVDWLVCSDSMCQPGSQTISLTVPVSSEQPRTDARWSDLFSKAREKIPLEITSNLHTYDDHYEIELPGEDLLSPGDATYFYPEHQGVVDLSSHPTVTQKEGRHLLSLKSLPTHEQHLKGVLVVHREKSGEKSLQSYAINTPINANHEIAAIDQPVHAVPRSNETSFKGGVATALLFAFVGGMILNLMPCVLPVLSFKVLSLVKMAGESRALRLKHGLLFSFGILVSFWIIAGLMLALRSYGQAVGWGFQLQEPLFVAGLAILLFVFALSLFGVFEIGMGVASLAGEAQGPKGQRSENFHSFFSGVLATAVATPCTGPFLGSAVGFAVTLPIFQGMLIFTFLGLGLSFPYLLLVLFPPLLRYLPKPGPWMETFKQLMGFLLLATVLWLLWVFSAQTSPLALIALLGCFLSFSVAAWIYGRWSTPIASKKERIFAYAFTTLFALAGISMIGFSHEFWVQESALSPEIAAEWEPFSQERVASLQKQGVPVLIDFTAKWCLICQANHLTLSNHAVSQKLEQSGVVRMKADWTKNDPMITEALSQFGRNSVPLYVLYGCEEKEDPQILPQVLTPDIVLNSIEKIKKK